MGLMKQDTAGLKKEEIAGEVERALLAHYERYYRLAYGYVRNREDALDVVQESACRAIRDCGKLTDQGAAAAWIYRIVINTALDMLRKRKRELLTEELPEEEWNDRYRDMDLEEMLGRLDEKSRSVILLRYFEDRKLEEVARILDENVSTVKARLYRTLKKLRISLEEEESSSEAGKGEGYERR